MDNTGGAKPKTVTSINSSGTNGQQGSSSSSNSTQTLGAGPPRHRSQRMENGYLPRSSGRAPRGMRGYIGNGGIGGGIGGGGIGGGGSGSNGYASRAMGDDATHRRATIPAATGGRARHSSSTQTRSNAPHQRFTDYSPLRGANRLETRAMPWQNGNTELRRRPLRYTNLSTSAPRVRDFMSGGPLESPNGDVLPPLSPCIPPPASPSLHGILSSSEDSDSESGSPVSPPGGSSQLQSPPSYLGERVSLSQANGGDSPLYGNPLMGRGQDAALARELLQSEMDMIVQRDEAMARQLQEEIDDDGGDDDDIDNDSDRPSTSSSTSTSLLFSGGVSVGV